MKNKIFAFLLLGVLFVGGVCAADSYVESVQKLTDQVSQSEKNIRDDINSFNAAFKDTFRLVDDEISRLIMANAAMAGIIFAMMFLVYAKTTSRTKRDLQVLLAAHAKHVDNLVSSRLDEFEGRMDARFKARDTGRLSKLGSEFDMIVDGMVKTDDNYTRRSKLEAPEEGRKPIERESKEQEEKNELMVLDEPKVDKDGKAKLRDKPSLPGTIVLRRLKRGFLRLLGKNKPRESVVEFKK
jgi:hypothetical protein